MLWSRPENRQTAGKLLVVGGHAQTFAAPAQAYQFAAKAGIGTSRVVLPDSLQKIVGPVDIETVFVPSSAGGSLAKSALGELLEQAAWCDAVMLAGDFGHNSETAILLEQFIQKFDGPLTITKDCIENFYSRTKAILDRPDTIISGTTGQLQKLLIGAPSMHPIYYGMSLLNLVETMHKISGHFPSFFITRHQDQLVLAGKGQVSTTKDSGDVDFWRVPAAAYAAVWRLQNPAKPFEAMTAGLFQYVNGNSEE